eukprot:NODE_56_length_28873_cov_1.243101.p5 type:complete len:489 gc:universal NODE_56_length_28873_cov_1.243101:17747-16281(-)
MDQKLLKRDSIHSVDWSPVSSKIFGYGNRNSMFDLQYQVAWIKHHQLKIIILVCYYSSSLLMINATMIHYSTYPLLIRIAKSCAMGININLGIIAIPVAKNLISFLRISWCRYLLPLKQVMYIHNLAGYHILYYSVIHVAAHTLNYLKVAETYGNTLYFNDFEPERLLINTLPGYTGLALSVLLFLMLTSIPLRRLNFELFYFSHFLAVPLMVISLFHGTSCFINQFIGMQCHYYGYRFIPVSLFLYFIEYNVSKYFKSSEGKIIAYEWINSEVIQLTIDNVAIGSDHSVGSYIFLNAPHLSKYEYHPFTVSEIHSDASFSLEMKVTGDWTKSLATTIEMGYDKIIIEGPYFTTSSDFRSYNTLILISQGIGMTSFQALMSKLEKDFENNIFQIPKVEVVYLFKNEIDERSLSSTNHSLPHVNISKFTKTKNWPPNFHEIFQRISFAFQNQKIGVYVCGSQSLSNLIQELAIQYSRDGNVFDFTSESY